MTTQEPAARTPSIEFSGSPVVEVALAVAFQPIPNLRTIEFGRLWEDGFRSRFPKVQEQPRIEMATEQFGPLAGAPPFSFQILESPLLPRLWFLNEDETQLVQLQNDWFARNWRQMQTGRNYPHYPQIRGPFEDDLRAVLAHLERHSLGSFKPTQCEITYTNHIPIGGGGPADVRDVLTVFRAGSDLGQLGNPDNVRAALQWIIRTDDEPIGRLHITADPAIR